MKFCWATIRIKDLEESLEFYEGIVGLKVSKRMDMGEGKTIVFLGKGETKLEMIYNKEYKDIDMGDSITLGFEVDSADEKIEFIKGKGLEIHSGPFSPVPSTKFFYVMDPNGLKIQFVENIK